MAMKTKTVKKLSHDVEVWSKIVNDLKTELIEVKQKLDFQKNLLGFNKETKSDFTCNKCGNCYQCRKILRIHIKQEHKRMIACSECHFEGTSISALDEHISLDHDDSCNKSFHCTECKENFMSEWILKMHKQSPHNSVIFTTILNFFHMRSLAANLVILMQVSVNSTNYATESCVLSSTICRHRIQNQKLQ